MGGFFAELKRRHVYKVAAAYVAAAFFLLEGVGMLLEPFDVPDWVHTVRVIAVMAGFPIVIVLAWIYDIRAGRITRTEALAEGTSEAGRRQRHALQIVGVVLSLVFAIVIGWWFLSR